MSSILSLFKKTKPDDEYYYKNEGVIVLEVYLHCKSCVEIVLKALRGFYGVEEVEAKLEENRVIVKGTECDPDRIADRVKHKLGNNVTIISPVRIKKEKKKEEPPKVRETVLNMYMHCDGCAEKVRSRIFKLEGIQSVKLDRAASTVTVKGTVDPKDLIDYINKKKGLMAEVVIPKKQKDQNQNQNDGKKKHGEKKEEKDSKKKEEKDSVQKDWRTTGLSYPNDPRGFDYATEMFSDENTEGCSIM